MSTTAKVLQKGMQEAEKMNNQAGQCDQSEMDINVSQMMEMTSVFEDESKTDTRDGNELDSMDTITMTFKIQSNRLLYLLVKP